MEAVIEVYVEDNDNETKVETQAIKELFSDFKTSDANLIDDEDVKEEEEREREDEIDFHETKRKQSDDGPPKKRIYLQKYRKEWESIPAYKPWLSESVLGSHYFYCKFCKNNNRCGRTEIEKHMTCRKHIRNSKMPQHKVQKKFTFRGLMCSAFTPFSNKDNEINYSLIPEYAKYLLSCGIQGVLINDVVGEGMSLTTTERMKITDEWVKICEYTKQHLMVQVGGAPLKDVLEMVRHAEKKKVGSIVVLPDLYSKPKDHFDLMRYVKIVSDSGTSVPLFYNHNPAYTGITINMTKFLSDILGEIDSFVGIIFTNDNLKEAVSALQVNEDKFNVFIGTDEITLGALVSGFNSFVSVAPNFFPRIVLSIHENIKLNNIKDAKEAQILLNGALEAICRHGEWLPTIKAAMNLLTPVKVGSVRDPLVSVWQDKVNKMKSDLQQLKVTQSF